MFLSAWQYYREGERGREREREGQKPINERCYVEQDDQKAKTPELQKIITQSAIKKNIL
jgi:hypothetical protein